jgi:hypothetical protein
MLHPVKPGLDGAPGYAKAPGCLKNSNTGLNRQELNDPGIELIDHQSEPFSASCTRLPLNRARC